MHPINRISYVGEGVQTITPSPFTAQAIQQSVNNFLKDKPDAKGGALVSVTMKDGINFVFAERVKIGKDKDKEFVVTGWIGKKWSEPIDVGMAGTIFF